MSRRSRVRPLVVLAAAVPAVALAGCGHDADAEARDLRDSFCVTHPGRDVRAFFDVRDDPMVDNNEEMVRWLWGVEADSLERYRPPEIGRPADVVAKALRNGPIDLRPEDDPALVAAIGEVNTWLVANCGPPPATTP